MRYVVIGNSAAGVSAAWAIRRRCPAAEIEIIGNEAHPVYSRIMLIYWIASRVARNDLLLKSSDDYTASNITACLNEEVEEIDPKTHRLKTSRRAGVAYDRLLAATGASAVRPEIPGVHLNGVETLRSLEDAERILSRVCQGSTVVVVGGGLIGVRTAEAMSTRGMKVHIVVSSDGILSQMLDPQSAGILFQRIRNHGIDARLAVDVREFVGRDALEGVRLSDGSFIRTGLAVVGKGVRPNIGLLSGTGVQTGIGIKVDHHMATSVQDIYAAGDAVEAHDCLRSKPWINALWPNAVEQGRIAGINMTGGREPYYGAIRLNSLEVFGLPCISIGHVHEILTASVNVHTHQHDGIYRKLFLSGDRVVGAVLTGDIRGAGVLTELIRFSIPVSDRWIEDTMTRGPLYTRRLL